MASRKVARTLQAAQRQPDILTCVTWRERLLSDYGSRVAPTAQMRSGGFKPVRSSRFVQFAVCCGCRMPLSAVLCALEWGEALFGQLGLKSSDSDTLLLQNSDNGNIEYGYRYR